MLNPQVPLWADRIYNKGRSSKIFWIYSERMVHIFCGFTKPYSHLIDTIL